MPTITWPPEKIDGVEKAVIRLMATTVPGSAQGSMTAMSRMILPLNFSREIT